MIEYRIEKPAKISTVKFLWKKFLKNDPMWHFTLEDTYIEIRVSKVLPKLEKFFKSKRWKYTKFLYLDNIPLTRKYQEQFEHIFHGYSELSMLVPKKKNFDWELGDSEIRQVIERCIHLICNIFNFSGGGEARMISSLALGRAHLVGRLGGGLETFHEFNKRKRVKKMADKSQRGNKEKKKKKKK